MQGIPKKIQYVWVGGAPLPQLAQLCIASWKKNLPDYAITLWNEENSPMLHPYVNTMYAQKKWAFVSDYIRFWVLEREGGLYLDTDMEVLRSLDTFLVGDVFFARTSSDRYISCGIIGSTPHAPFIQAILREYDRMGDTGEWATSPQVVERVYTMYQHQSEIAIHPPELFYPCNVDEVCTPQKLAQAYTNHHWAESWVSFVWLRRLLRRLGFMRLVKKIV